MRPRESEADFFTRALIGALLLLALGQGLLLGWGALGAGPLAALAGVGEAPPRAPAPSSSPPPLGVLIEGLGRLLEDPEQTLAPIQARRIAAVLPLFRQALEESVEGRRSRTLGRLEERARAHVLGLLDPAQAASLERSARRGALEEPREPPLELLVGLEEALRLRGGLEEGLTRESAVRERLAELRVRDLLLGLVLLEDQPEARLTAAQARRILPMARLLEASLRRGRGEVGQAAVPLVEAQLRGLLSPKQAAGLARLADIHGLQEMEVNEVSLYGTVDRLLQARALGAPVSLHLERLMGSSQGPGEVGRAEAEPTSSPTSLLATVRGILTRLETHPQLRLTDTQVAGLALQAPRIREALNQARRGLEDERRPETQARLLGLLSPAQRAHLAEARPPAILRDGGDPSEEPWARELDRFLRDRRRGRAYSPDLEPAPRPAAEQRAGSARTSRESPGEGRTQGASRAREDSR